MYQSPSDFTESLTVSRLRNSQAAGEGKTLPPKMQNGVRVPLVNNLKVLKTDSFLGGTQVTLGWSVPSDNATLPIDSFLISVKGIQSGTADVNMTPVAAKTSPCVIRIMSSIATAAIITVQTVLSSGQSSLISLSPTVSVQTIAPAISTSDIPPSTLSGLNVVTGYNNLTVNGGVTYVDTNGDITEDATNLFWDKTNKRLGLQTSAPKSTLDVLGSIGLLYSSQNTNFTAGGAFLYDCDCTSGNIAVTLPSASGVTNRFYLFRKSDSSTNTLTVNSYVMTAQNSTLLICSTGSSWINLIHSIL